MLRLHKIRGFTLVEGLVAFGLLGLVVMLIHTWGTVYVHQGLEERWHTAARLQLLATSQQYVASPMTKTAWVSQAPAAGTLLQGIPYTLSYQNYTDALPTGIEGLTMQLAWHPNPKDSQILRQVSVGVLRYSP